MKGDPMIKGVDPTMVGPSDERGTMIKGGPHHERTDPVMKADGTPC